MSLIKKYKRIIATLFLAIFATYWVDTHLFYHIHIVNGVIIEHSHFYAKGHVQKNDHSLSGLILISMLSSVEALPFYFTLFSVFFAFYLALEFQREILITLQTCISYFPGRAPPVNE